MTNMTWSKAHSVGVQCIDDEHRELVALVNQIHEGLHTFAEENEIKKIFQQLADRASTHVRHEEKLFEDTRYPRAAIHAREHKHLMVILFGFQKGIDRTGQTVPFEKQASFLRDWLMDHILNEDKRFGDYLNAEQRSRVTPVRLP